MRVKECEKCVHHRRKTWSHVHCPKGFHRIGMTHAYAYCAKYEKRCSEVKSCEEGVKLRWGEGIR